MNEEFFIEKYILEGIKGRDFITTRNYTKKELEQLIYFSMELKRLRNMEQKYTPLYNKIIGLLFKKPSTRTRVSFQAGIAELGGTSIYMRPEELELQRGEPVKDTARVLDRYLNGLIIRTFEQSELIEYANYMKHPVINALTDLEHPCQVLADLMTIKEIKGKWEGLKMVYTGDVWNVAHSLIIEAPRFGMDLILAVPKGYYPNEEIWKFGETEATRNGTILEINHNLEESVKNADIIVANTWYSIGKDSEKEKRKLDFQGFTVTSKIMQMAKPDAIFMHCLPAFRGNEMTDEVIEGKWSVVWLEAENREHTEKAILASII